MFDPETQKNLDSWLNGQYDEKTKEQIRKTIKENPKEIKNAFFKKLSFGTGGARALMGFGTNRLNKYTIRALTQALAQHLKKTFSHTKIHVFIGFDNRNHSTEFANEAACTLAANGIGVFLLKELRPTPIISFGCRYKQCQAAIMITASHNPPQYNGYKLYWQGGGQILAPHDKNILVELNKIEDPSTIKTTNINNPLIQPILEEIDQAYLKELEKVNHFPQIVQKEGKKLKILYSNLHGTGITLIPKAFKNFGLKNFSIVEKQAVLDGNFPAAIMPNPEEKTALDLGLKELKEKKMDLFIATDPDADRVAAAVLHNNQPFIFSGNQMAALLLDHILNTLSEQKKLPEHSFCVKSIVTTELFSTIASAFTVECLNVLTGFKYIAEKIALLESKKTFLLGAEESLGYLYKDFVRDKDAISASYLIAEMALLAKLKGNTLFDKLMQIYQKYGLFSEKMFSLQFKEGQEGLEQMQKIMQNLRSSPPSKINQIPVIQIEDYLSSQKDHLQLNTSNFLTLPKANVLAYWLEDKSKIIIRPSGTEPKVKVYLGVQEENAHNHLEQKIQANLEKLDLLEKKIRKELLVESITPS